MPKQGRPVRPLGDIGTHLQRLGVLPRDPNLIKSPRQPGSGGQAAYAETKTNPSKTGREFTEPLKDD
jgi:hypothetical protein